jgi:integrase
MNFKISKLKTLGGDRHEVRAWDGSGEHRSEWRRRFKTKSDAQNFVDEAMFKDRQARIDFKRTGGDPLLTNTFRMEYDHWKATRYPDFAPGWKTNVDRYWRDFEPQIASLTIKEITPSLMRQIERELREIGNSRATIQRKIVWLQSVLNYSVEMERITFNPIARFKSAKPLKAELEFWEKSDAMSFLKFALAKYPADSEDHWKYLVYLVALNTAMRSGEIWALRASSMKHSYGVVYVNQQFDLSSRTFRTLKGKEPRNVPLSMDLSSALVNWIEYNQLGPNDLLFSTNGSPIDHNNFAKRIFNRDLKEWDGPSIRFHGLRHTSATLMLDAGIDIRTVQAILGHKNVETTLRYVHAISQNVRLAGKTYSLAPEAELKLLGPAVELA